MLDLLDYIDEYTGLEGRTLTTLAAAAGCSVRYLSEVTYGRHRPSAEVADAVAEELRTAGVLPPDKVQDFRWNFRNGSFTPRSKRLASTA